MRFSTAVRLWRVFVFSERKSRLNVIQLGWLTAYPSSLAPQMGRALQLLLQKVLNGFPTSNYGSWLLAGT
jgi:hypothetical protein